MPKGRVVAALLAAIAVAAGGVALATGLVGGSDDAASLTGGDGEDKLSGTAGDDVLDAGAGDDVVEAEAGDDEIRGGAGRDFLYGGDGDDRFLASEDDALDVHDCGGGRDVVTEPDTRDELLPSCEEARWTAGEADDDGYENTVVLGPRIARGRLAFSAACPERRCAGAIELRTPNDRKLLGRGRFALAAGPRGPLGAKLTERGREAVARGGYVRVVLRSGGVNSGFTTYVGP